MTILIFVSAVLVAIVLQRQEHRHIAEERLEYDRLRISPVALLRPRAQFVESCLAVYIGIFLFLLGSLLVLSLFEVPSELRSSTLIDGSAFFLATGIALVIVGSSAIRQNIRFKRLRTGNAPSVA